MPVKFNAIIEIREGNPYILVNKARALQIKKDWRRPMPVRIRLNDMPAESWKINMMPVGEGSFYLYLHGDVRGPTNTKVGDKVAVSIEFDEQYKNGPQHEMPDWFAVALTNNHTARNNWEALPPSRQKEILRYFSWLKSDKAKERNLQKAVYVLSGGEGRFMARSWRNGK